MLKPIQDPRKLSSRQRLISAYGGILKYGMAIHHNARLLLQMYHLNPHQLMIGSGEFNARAYNEYAELVRLTEELEYTVDINDITLEEYNQVGNIWIKSPIDLSKDPVAEVVLLEDLACEMSRIKDQQSSH